MRFANQLFRPVLSTPPIRVNPRARVVLYSLVDRRNCRAYLVAAKSFLRFGADVRVVVQDDGTLDAACRRELETHLPGIEILSRDGTLQFIQENAGETLLQTLPDLERCNPFIALKLVNVVLRFPGQQVIVIDSDLVFLREPILILDWIQHGGGSCFYSDGGSRLAETFHNIGFDFRKVDVADFNSGLLGFHNTVTAAELGAVLSKIEEYDPRLFQHWEIEQAIWSVLFNSLQRPVNLEHVRPSYVGSGWWTCERLLRESVLVHFVGSIRFKNLRYLKLANKVIRELKSPRPESGLRTLARGALVSFFSLLTAPLWFTSRLQAAITGGESIFSTCAEFLSLFPGRLGIYLRRGFYRRTLDDYAVDASIGFGTILAHPQVRIARGVSIGPRCTLGRVVLDEYVTIGSNVDLLSGRRQHNFDDLDTPIQNQGGSFQPVHIGRNGWIGNSAVIMADVGADCVIGAGSVVVKPIPAQSVAAGNPATVKKRRAADKPDRSGVAAAQTNGSVRAERIGGAA
jgi:virginiamycin A acetyltransferase